MTLKMLLTQGLQALSLDFSAAQTQRCLDYLALLQKWNKAYNLTAIRDPQEMVTKHLLDSLSIQPYLVGDAVLDVGTGAGLPGIPLAIAEPGKRFILLDSNGKKIRFVRQAAIELGLSNVEAIHGRIEALQDRQFSTITTRAFSALSDMHIISPQLLASEGVLLAMKGALHADDRVPEAYQLVRTQVLAVPGVPAARHVLVLQPNMQGLH